MISNKYIYALLVLFLLSSCTTGKLWRSGVPTENISRLDYLQPVSFIDYIEKGNFQQYNDSLSASAERILASILVDYNDKLPLNNRVNTIFDNDRKFIESELTAIVDALESRTADFYYLTLSKELVGFMNENNSNYLMGVVSYGMMRRPGNYTGQILKSIGIGILTFGMYYPVPVKSTSNLYVMILDAENENLAFYRRSVLQDQSPLDQQVLNKQLSKIFNGYFYEQ